MSDVFGLNDKKGKIKELIKKLHAGYPLEEAKKEFSKYIGDINPDQLAKIEEELIRDGMPVDEVHKLCDAHIALMKESLEKSKPKNLDNSHPIQILYSEHDRLIDFSEKLKDMVNSGNIDPEKFDHIIEHLKESEKHYLREENALFPFLEKHGITQPPDIMWMEHDNIRAIKKKIYSIADKREYKATEELKNLTKQLHELLSSHFYKENNILFPTALRVIVDSEWVTIRKDFDEIGYCCFTPEPGEFKTSFEEPSMAKSSEEEGWIQFDTGKFKKEEIEAILDTLPVDITFVDANDEVRYFNQSKERIFARTKAVIGRKVQQCHPQKSVHIVNKIVEDFKNNKRDSADFWINMNDRLIYIRYFPVRDKNGKYLGVIEVTQDITEIKKLTGEKRLLDS